MINPQDKVSKYFTWGEVLRSGTASISGLKNVPPEEALEFVRWCFENIADPIRELFGKPMRVKSGYRSPEVNRLAGGVDGSDHQWDETQWAIDFEILGVPLQEVHDKVKQSNLPFTRVILERGSVPDSESDDCVHVGVDRKLKDRRAGTGATHNRSAYQWENLPLVEIELA